MSGNVESLVLVPDSTAQRDAAVIVEPLLARRWAMIVNPEEFMRGSGRLTTAPRGPAHADEVRPDSPHLADVACDRARVFPILCASPRANLPAGFLPLAPHDHRPKPRCLVPEDRRRNALFNATLYTSQPIACAAANAIFTFFDTEQVFESIADHRTSARPPAYQSSRRIRRGGRPPTLAASLPSNSMFRDARILVVTFASPYEFI